MGIISVLSVSRQYQYLERQYAFGDCLVRATESVPRNPGPFAEGAPSLLFLHGRLAASETWFPLLRHLGQQFRCILLDLPGYGGSFSAIERHLSFLEQAVLVQTFVARVAGSSGVVIIGHDLGGIFAQLAMLEQPSLVRALILINSASLFQRTPELRIGWFAWSARHALWTLLEDSVDLETERRDGLAIPWLRRESRLAMAGALKRIHSSWPAQSERLLWKGQVAKQTCPSLLLWGKKDRLNSPEKGMELLRLMPESYFYEHPHSGHWPQMEFPGWIAARVREFLFRLNYGIFQPEFGGEISGRKSL